MAAPTFLAALWVWGLLDKKFSDEYISLYKPIPIPDNPTFTTHNPSFLPCLESYLLNDPLEIILITRPLYCQKGIDTLGGASFSSEKIQVVFARDDMPGIRGQMATGFLRARGSITAKVDSHIMWPSHYLTHLLPCFEDPSNPSTITPAEVASTRAFDGRLRTTKVAAFVAHRWRWIVCGASYLVRTEIVHCADFLDAFLHDVWHGPFGRTRLDTGDDTFTSRRLTAHGYIHVPQAMPETDVTRMPKRSVRALVMQLVRWERSTIQSMLRCTWETPGVWGDAFVARRTVERLFRDVLLYVHLWAWWGTFRTWPALGAVLLGYYLGQKVVSLQGFFAGYPYMRRYWWAAVLGYYGPVLVAPWAWLTLGTEEWFLGDDVGGREDA
ncbi:hypothetical protein B0T18DRAFT_484379 [Schizothecium vesticola]|uniref:Glycosyltransferase family 2 protein n=1 Tax=Schizothecium vesticola TaxID=314040 RepID=A0AA40F9S2_9PEZI|nr:hypothetical protein B0T18DRAFT_484379 [Schizothecium vesticola]